jgi:dihydropteroate synthase
LRLANVVHDLTYHALVLGILNRTRDSFYDGGRNLQLDALLRRAEELVSEGADVLEVGARPGGVGVAEVTESQETDLAAETLSRLKARFDVPLAVDTTRAAVAREALRAGAVLANDMSGFRDPDYLAVVGTAEAAVVATHCRLPPGVPDPDPQYEDVVGDICQALAALIDRARRAGIPAECVVIDPGLDLGKTWRQSLELLAAFPRLASLGRPILLAASHKNFLGRLLDLDLGARGHATTAANTAGILRGARLLRVHDVGPARQAADLAEALLRADAGLPVVPAALSGPNAAASAARPRECRGPSRSRTRPPRPQAPGGP